MGTNSVHLYIYIYMIYLICAVLYFHRQRLYSLVEALRKQIYLSLQSTSLLPLLLQLTVVFVTPSKDREGVCMCVCVHVCVCVCMCVCVCVQMLNPVLVLSRNVVKVHLQACP